MYIFLSIYRRLRGRRKYLCAKMMNNESQREDEERRILALFTQPKYGGIRRSLSLRWDTSFFILATRYFVLHAHGEILHSLSSRRHKSFLIFVLRYVLLPLNGQYIRDTFTVNVLKNLDPNFDNFSEYLFLELLTHSSKILFAVNYLWPHGVTLKFFDDLIKLLPPFTNVILIGDFNINIAKQDGESKYFTKRILNKSLYLVPSQPINHHDHRGWSTHTWLYLFILNHANAVTYYKKSIAPFVGESGHDFI